MTGFAHKSISADNSSHFLLTNKVTQFKIALTQYGNRGILHHGLEFQPTMRQRSWEANIRHSTTPNETSELGQRRATPRQACPRPNGFGRNLRSKTRWFAGFCNSHQVSHFATFFIDARAEISVAESHFDSCI